MVPPVRRKERLNLKLTIALIALLFIIVAPSLAEDICESAYNQALESYKSNSELQQTDFSKGQDAQKQLASFIIKKLQDCPNEPKLYSMLSDLYISFGQNDKALKTANRAIELWPTSWEANFSFSTALSLTGNSSESISYLKKAIDLAPPENKEHLLANLCSVLEFSKQYEQAIDACTNLINTSKQHRPFGYYARGRSMAALGKNEEAKKDYSKAKELGFSGEWWYSDEHLKGGKTAPNQKMGCCAGSDQTKTLKTK
jgi:tetratricopeptide (TPR) repeat protein